MRLAVVSHKVCQRDENSPSGFAADGGFPLQIEAISELFDRTKIIMPFRDSAENTGVSPLKGKKLEIRPLPDLQGKSWRRKFNFPVWFSKNAQIIWREIKCADAVHAPIPGDVGTIGLFFAMLQRKPLFVRHCGNWLVQTTAAEQFWKWMIEKFAGGRNVMLVTGGSNNPPSAKNPNVKWIFSTSLRNTQIAETKSKKLPADGKLKLLIACRQEERKGTDVVIESLPKILDKFPGATLDVVGGGSLLGKFRQKAKELQVQDKVTFYGKIEQSRVVEVMKKAHVFCFPTSASEGFPKVVIEALACGLPVITTRVSVLPKLIGDEGGGILLDSPTSENLAEAVSDLCGNVEFYEKMSARAIGTARNYSLENWRDFIDENLREAWNVASLSSV